MAVKPFWISVISMVARGDYAGAAINHRLSSEAIWPAPVHDCKAAVRWLRANAKKYGIDANHMGVIGSSVGGQLAAIIGTSGDVAALEGDLGEHKGVSSRVTCVVMRAHQRIYRHRMAASVS